MSTRKTISRLYGAEWPYPLRDGIGLRFSGYPADPASFCEILEDFGCPPPAAHRVLRDLETGRERCVTVVAYINVGQMMELLVGSGVSVVIVPPDSASAARTGYNADLDFAAMCLAYDKPVDRSRFSSDDNREIDRRFRQFTESFAAAPHGLGGFSYFAETTWRPPPPDPVDTDTPSP